MGLEVEDRETEEDIFKKPTIEDKNDKKGSTSELTFQ